MKYQHLFFDLDNTLWDFGKNCAVTLTQLHDKYQLDHKRLPVGEFIAKYREVNNELWYQFHIGEATKEDIRSKRFALTFDHFGTHEYKELGLDDEFLTICPAQGHLYPNTLDILDYLVKKGYKLHIITNGFKETQHIKISTSGLKPYFIEVIEMEDCGYKKPDIRIFEYAFKRSGAKAAESMMIGDDYEADVLGAKNAGMDQIFVNLNGILTPEKPTHEILNLIELKEIL